MRKIERLRKIMREDAMSRGHTPAAGLLDRDLYMVVCEKCCAAGLANAAPGENEPEIMGTIVETYCEVSMN